MRTERQADGFLAFTMVAVLMATACVPIVGAAPARDAASDIFQNGYIAQLKIEIPREGMAGLRRNPRSYVRATVREGATTYTNVAVHLKGAIGSFRQVDDNP